MPALFEIVLLQLFQVLIKKKEKYWPTAGWSMLLTSTWSVATELWTSMING